MQNELAEASMLAGGSNANWNWIVLVREDASAFLAGVQVELVRLYAQHGAVDASRGSERKQAPVCLSASKGLSLCVWTDEENGKDRKLVALGVTMPKEKRTTKREV
jgi:hypothetical protein